MFKDRSKMLFLSALLATSYVAYLIIAYNNILDQYSDSASIFALIMTALVLPHFIAMTVSTVFIWISFIMKKAKVAVFSLIIMIFATLSFILYAPFLIPIIITLIFGFRNQEKLLKKIT